MTLYVPGAISKEKNNEAIVLDIAPTGDHTQIAFIDRAILEGEATELP